MMFKLNNKGFAVSAVLYTLLIAFLLFLGVTLAQFSASTNLLNNANKDLINGTEFSVKQVRETSACDNGAWYLSPYILQIKSRYGTMYWPKDFSEDSIKYENGFFNVLLKGYSYKNIKVVWDNNNPGNVDTALEYMSAINVCDIITDNCIDNIKLYDICQ